MYCSFCGQKVYDEENFCPNCGHKINKSRVISGNKDADIVKKDAQVVEIDSFLSEISKETNNVVKENKVEVSKDTASKYSNASVISPPTYPMVQQTQDYSFHIKTETAHVTSNYSVSKVFMIIGAINIFLSGIISLSLYGANFLGIIYLLSPVWTIPMIHNLFERAFAGERPSIGFKICSMLFVNGIAGILMLCDK